MPAILGASQHSATRSYSNPLNAAVESSDGPVSDSGSAPNDQMATFLDSILRCRIRGETRELKTFPGSIPFVRQLVSNGLLVNSFAWVKACVDSQTKKSHAPATQKSCSILNGLVDEEDNSILRIAVLLGCSPEILNFLIGRGAVVETNDLQKAAETDQAGSLALLLKHSPAHLVRCPGFSQSVQDVLADAKARQEQLDLRMRDEVGGFMVQLLRRLLSFGLTARRRSLPRVELCSKAIAEVLVGNSLLQSLLSPQRSGKHLDHEMDSLACENEDDSAGRVVANDGLLSVLPTDIVQQAYLSENYLPRFLALVEDFMCSKDMNDGAIGLSLLSTMLRRHPEVRRSDEVARFGMMKLIQFHEDLASSRLADIQRRQARAGASKNGPTVCCPSKHIATLFITRHSSFRCDICGNGVDRGRPMHGCRRCDWDACEVCTDKAQSGIVKCKAIKDLVSSTRRMLSDPTFSFTDIAGAPRAIAHEFQELSARLLDRDTRALRDIGVMLLTPGKVSIHQIKTVFLPAFHAAYISSANEDHLHRKPVSPSARRCKKARVIDGLSDLSLESPEDKLKFCVQSIRLLVTEDDRIGKTRPTPLAANDDTEESRSSADHIHVYEVTFSNAFQELLRRLHQILAMYERVESFDSAPEYVSTVASPDQKGSDLQNLTKPIELRLYSSSSSAPGVADEGPPALTVQVEPLVPINDVSLQILRSCRLLDESFTRHCKT
jgi:hypothetical protein